MFVGGRGPTVNHFSMRFSDSETFDGGGFTFAPGSTAFYEVFLVISFSP